MTRLEALAADQSEIKHHVTLLVGSETRLMKAQVIQLERLRPSKLAWLGAIFFLAVSGVVIVAGALINSRASSLSSEAASAHQSAQADRVVVVEQLLEDFEPLDQVNSLGLPELSELPYKTVLELIAEEGTVTKNTLSAAENEMSAANKLDAKADQVENDAGRDQLLSQIMLGLGSAFFGATLGWAIMQFLAELRWRKESEPKLAKTTS
jgi:hypothetical protein